MCWTVFAAWVLNTRIRMYNVRTVYLYLYADVGAIMGINTYVYLHVYYAVQCTVLEPLSSITCTTVHTHVFLDSKCLVIGTSNCLHVLTSTSTACTECTL